MLQQSELVFGGLCWNTEEILCSEFFQYAFCFANFLLSLSNFKVFVFFILKSFVSPTSKFPFLKSLFRGTSTGVISYCNL